MLFFPEILQMPTGARSLNPRDFQDMQGSILGSEGEETGHQGLQNLKLAQPQGKGEAIDSRI